MKNSNPSLQGGVVSDPLYVCKSWDEREVMREVKFRGPVAVTLPGSAMVERDGTSESRRGVDGVYGRDERETRTDATAKVESSVWILGKGRADGKEGRCTGGLSNHMHF
jgi:hypothetical protein